MRREQLEEFSEGELVEIILQQQATIEQLLARVATLEDQIKRLTQPPKDASDFSTPPSKNRKPNRPNRKSNAKRGPKPGHPVTHLQRPGPVLHGVGGDVASASDTRS